MFRRTSLAFLLGLCQVFVAILVEVLVYYYLSYLDDIMKIIVKFVSMAKIVQFDDRYASAMKEHVIKSVRYKQLKITFHRRYLFEDSKK